MLLMVVLLEMFLAHKRATDINLFFDDLNANSLLDRQGAIANYWSKLGLRPRFDDSTLDVEDEDN